MVLFGKTWQKSQLVQRRNKGASLFALGWFWTPLFVHNRFLGLPKVALPYPVFSTCHLHVSVLLHRSRQWTPPGVGSTESGISTCCQYLSRFARRCSTIRSSLVVMRSAIHMSLETRGKPWLATLGELNPDAGFVCPLSDFNKMRPSPTHELSSKVKPRFPYQDVVSARRELVRNIEARWAGERFGSTSICFTCGSWAASAMDDVTKHPWNNLMLMLHHLMPTSRSYTSMLLNEMLPAFFPVCTCLLIFPELMEYSTTGVGKRSPHR